MKHVKQQPSFYLTAFFVLIILTTLFLQSQIRSSFTDAPPAKASQSSQQADTTTPSPPETAYGFVKDSFKIMHDQVQWQQTLGTILSDQHVSRSTIHQIAQKARDTFDVTDIRKGDEYQLFCTPDSPHIAKGFVYTPNPIDYYVIDWRDSVHIYKGEHPVRTEIKHTTGVIYSSLYETLQRKDLSPMLAIKLSEIFAWEIDFFRITEGDRFKVFYEQKFVEDQPVEIGDILAAYFYHREEGTYAIRFHQNGKSDYFDTTGNSLRKALLKAPLRYSRITSHFTYRRYHPVLNRYTAHKGTDYAAPPGTPVRSVGDGVVQVAGYDKYNGNWIKIRHNSVYTTGYLHLTDIANGIYPGKKVKQGQTIGYVGSTGLATGPHLCYRFWKNGRQVDPFDVEIPPSEPIKKQYQEEYNRLKENWVQRLDHLSYPFPPSPQAMKQLSSPPELHLSTNHTPFTRCGC